MVSRLQSGVDEWNRWRHENPRGRPNLRNADLSNLDLEGANLVKAYLSDINLKNSNLFGIDAQGAIFSRVNFGGATLVNAKLMNAKFYDSRFVGVNFGGTNLAGAQLQNSDFSGSFVTKRPHNIPGPLIVFNRTNLEGAILKWCHFQQSSFDDANLCNSVLLDGVFDNSSFENVNLANANLNGASFKSTNFHRTNLYNVQMRNSTLNNSNFCNTFMKNADLAFSSLEGANFQNTLVENANFDYCSIYGISVWDLVGTPISQNNLMISNKDDLEISVDNLEVAQFIYLLVNNEKIRQIFNTLTTKIVLILGRFSEERKPILDYIRTILRQNNLIPILFDFEKPANRDITETVSTLAHLSKFIIADITDARTVAAELEHVVPHLPSVPVQPILQLFSEEYAWCEHMKHYPWFLELEKYKDQQDLEILVNKIIIPKIIALRE